MVASIAHNFKCDRYYANLINNLYSLKWVMLHLFEEWDRVWVRLAAACILVSKVDLNSARVCFTSRLCNHDSTRDNFTELLGEPFESTLLVGNGGIERLVFKCRKGWESSDASLSTLSLCMDMDVSSHSNRVTHLHNTYCPPVTS